MFDSQDISFEVLSTLRQIIRAMDIHSKKLVKTYGLTGPQLVLLKEIYRNGSISVSELAKRASLSQATVTSILDRLESKGYVERIRSASDKRKVMLTTTEKSKDKLDGHPSILQEEFVKKFNRLREWEQTLILSSLQRIASMMGVQDFNADYIDIELEHESQMQE